MDDLKRLDIKQEVENYIQERVWQSKENSNQRFSYSSVSWRLACDVMARYTLDNVYSEQISKAHIEGDLHIHNLGMGIAGYCCGWSLEDILRLGVGVEGQVICKPAKHFNSVLNQIVDFLGIVSNEWSGAQALNSLDVFLAPFIRNDGLSYEQVKQSMQSFIYTMNLPTRWGGQTPFINITFDLKVPSDLAQKPVVIGGQEHNQTYSEFQPEIDMINRAFVEIMIEGNSHQRVLSFPIPTYNVSKDFEWDSPIADLIFEMTAKYGIPYFQNFINSDLDPHSVRAMCCHLRLDLTQLKHRRVGGFFGYADKTGSVGVVTMNMSRLGYMNRNKDAFFKKLSELMDFAKESLEIKRKIVSNYIQCGLFPFTKKYLCNLNTHFSTIGLIGMNECCLNFLGKDISTTQGKQFACEVLKFMREKLVSYQKETGTLFNLEATPGESCGYRMARLDKNRFSNIITAGEQEPYYTNSTWLPVNYTPDVTVALEHQKDLQPLYTGGTIFHTFLGERLSSLVAKQLIRRILENYNLPYITLTPTFSICDDHGYIDGEHFLCPTCGKQASVYSRVVGFLTPVQNWNKGKREEFKDRTEYSM